MAYWTWTPSLNSCFCAFWRRSKSVGGSPFNYPTPSCSMMEQFNRLILLSDSTWPAASYSTMTVNRTRFLRHVWNNLSDEQRLDWQAFEDDSGRSTLFISIQTQNKYIIKYSFSVLYATYADWNLIIPVDVCMLFNVDGDVTILLTKFSPIIIN